MFLNNYSNYPIGLDISDLSLKLVQLNKINNKIKIQALSKINLPKGIICNGIIKNQEKVIEAIKTLIANPIYGKINSKEIIACLPETKTFIKLIKINKTADSSKTNSFKKIISQEIEKYIPMSLDEIYYDWQIVEDLQDTQSILIGAASKDIVDQYINLLHQAKLSIIALEIESISICRSLLTEEIKPFSSSPNNYAIIDIGANHTSMIFYSKNTVLFTSSIPLSGEQITNNIENTLKLDSDLAEKAKIVCGFDENKANGVIKNILTDIIKNLINKIQESLEFYNYNFADRGALKQILLCGGGANIKNLTQIIKQATNIETKIGNPLVNLAKSDNEFLEIFKEKYSFNLNSLKKNSNNKKALSITQDSNSIFSTAIGLALRGVIIDEI